MSRMILAFTTELPVTAGICNRFGVMAANSSPCKHRIQNKRVTSVAVPWPCICSCFFGQQVLPTKYFYTTSFHRLTLRTTGQQHFQRYCTQYCSGGPCIRQAVLCKGFDRPSTAFGHTGENLAAPHCSYFSRLLPLRSCRSLPPHQGH